MPNQIDSMDTTEKDRLDEQNNKTSNGFLQPVFSTSDETQSDSKKSKGLLDCMWPKKGTKKYPDYVQIALAAESKSKFPLEWWKTGIAFIYFVFCLVLTAVMATVVHERVPPKELNPPLPDKFFDYFDRVEWAFTVSEINGIILTLLWIIQWLLLSYKSIVGRRYFFILGTLQLYRCVTMYVTTLPVPGMHFKCAPKLNGDIKGMIQRILRLISGAGLSITGSHLLCGDYLYSGHTLLLTLTYLFIKEYSPRCFWWYHLFCWVMSAVGIIFILLAHEHYTVDVIVSYYITTRFFWWYHTMASEKNLKVSSQTNFMSRAWWYPIFSFFEKNVQDPIPCIFTLPTSWPPSCLKSLYKKVFPDSEAGRGQ